jgi:predicted nucleic acid-binding protein
LIAVDTSVVVAAFASWHEAHATSAAVLARRPRVPAHVLVESFSVLTRLPPPHRSSAALVATFLGERFKEAPLVLAARDYRSLLQELMAHGLSGGVAYDALIAATVRHAGATLLTRDRRACVAYQRMKVAYELVD